jgi:hypothetical protein
VRSFCTTLEPLNRPINPSFQLEISATKPSPRDKANFWLKKNTVAIFCHDKYLFEAVIFQSKPKSFFLSTDTTGTSQTEKIITRKCTFVSRFESRTRKTRQAEEGLQKQNKACFNVREQNKEDATSRRRLAEAEQKQRAQLCTRNAPLQGLDSWADS